MKLFLLPFALLLVSCAAKQINLPLQGEPVDASGAPLAWFSEGNAPQYVRDAVAKGLQHNGLYNFYTEDISEEVVKNAAEIRLYYSEEKSKSSVPTLVLNVEILFRGILSNKISINEESNVNFFLPWKNSSEKKYRQEVLVTRFIEEVKKVKHSQE